MNTRTSLLLVAFASFTTTLLSTSTSVYAQAAPPLTSLQVTYVFSTNKGLEPIAANQTTTSSSPLHGGPQLTVITEEYGYGNVRVARIAGAVLPTAANYATNNICRNASGQIVPCAPGLTVVGFQRFWNLNGYPKGVFSYQNTSTNNPRNTISDSIWIR